MQVFIDESGTNRTSKNSSFVLVYVESSNVPKLESEIISLEKELNIELFHWADQGWKVKTKFIEKCLGFDFIFKVAVLKNPVFLKRDTVKVLEHLLVEKKFDKVILDGKKPAWFERSLKSVLRSKGISVKKLRTVRSRSFPVIRLADALAGLVRYEFDNPGGRAEALYKRAGKKITVLLKTVS